MSVGGGHSVVVVHLHHDMTSDSSSYQVITTILVFRIARGWLVTSRGHSNALSYPDQISTNNQVQVAPCFNEHSRGTQPGAKMMKHEAVAMICS